MRREARIVLSGMRPTGRLHYGNYFGAIADFLRLQERGERCHYFIADYHALTTVAEPTGIERQVIEMLRTYVACGLDPSRAVIYRQSDLPRTAELALLLGMITSIGFLQRGTTYKDRLAKLRGEAKAAGGNPLSYGLLGYPVLMAADILIVRADTVPVGDDQRQHVEMAADIAQRFNARFGETLKVPASVPRSALRLPGLDGAAKMGKSEGNALYLLDDPETIRRKIRAVPTTTDPLPLRTSSNEPDDVIPEMPATVGLLYRLLSLTASRELYEEFVERYRRKEKFYGLLKSTLVERLTAFNAPIIARFHDPRNDEASAREWLRTHAAKVAPLAAETVESVREAMGIGPSLLQR